VRKYILLLTPFILASCYQQERNCKSFKTGTFSFTTTINNEEKTTTFTRNDTLEVDYFEGKVDSSAIQWINDCEYIVKKINPKSMAEKKAIHMKILTTNGNEYTFEYGVVGSNNKQRGTAKKIK
jgi:hypothetical protein